GDWHRRDRRNGDPRADELLVFAPALAPGPGGEPRPQRRALGGLDARRTGQRHRPAPRRTQPRGTRRAGAVAGRTRGGGRRGGVVADSLSVAPGKAAFRAAVVPAPRYRLPARGPVRRGRVPLPSARPRSWPPRCRRNW